LKNGFNYFVDEMSAEDRVAIVTYAGTAGVVLESTLGNEKETIKTAINSLGSGGSTAGAHGIVTAYEIAQQYQVAGGNNRIIIGTDGDFNVGPSSQEELVNLIKEKRELGIYLTVLGVGRGNLNDAALEQIANNGNGTYEYIDSLEQLRKVFIYDYNKFFTVATDVKVQIEFNPENVKAYRLVGYENRRLNQEDFTDDSKMQEK
jgi:Ca-activated chloride channel family protein